MTNISDLANWPAQHPWLGNALTIVSGVLITAFTQEIRSLLVERPSAFWETRKVRRQQQRAAVMAEVSMNTFNLVRRICLTAAETFLISEVITFGIIKGLAWMAHRSVSAGPTVDARLNVPPTSDLHALAGLSITLEGIRTILEIQLTNLTVVTCILFPLVAVAYALSRLMRDIDPSTSRKLK